MHDPASQRWKTALKGIRNALTTKGIRWTQLITDTDREQAIQKIRRALDADPTIRIVIGTGSADTEAAGLAIERFFAAERYLTAGFDLSPDILRLVKSGTIRFTVDQ